MFLLLIFAKNIRMQMNIALFGYGKMGKEIEKILLERGHSISHKIGSKTDLSSLDFSKTDAAIEFSTPDTAEKNIRFCIENTLPIIIGTTGWYDSFDEITSLCQTNQSAMLYATNFSIGVNLFFALNSKLAKLMNNYPDYACSLKEIHHTEKLDSPSGTGISLAEQIIEELDSKKEWENVSETETTRPTALSLESERLPHVPGTHIVKYEHESASEKVDKIEISHTAHSRHGFAYGSVLAVEWIKNKTGVFTMKDVLEL